MDIGEVIGGGFRIIRDKPLAVIVWALAYLLVFVGMMFLMRPMMEAQMGAAAVGNPEAQLATMSGLVGPFLLLYALMLIIYVVLFAAAQRAVLKPEQQGFFYLRLGMDELRLLALTILFLVVFCVVMVVMMVAMVALTGVIAGTSRSPGAAVGMALLDFLVFIAFTAWYYMRFGLAFPLTLMRGKIVIGEAWQISRGRFWALFTASLVVLIMIFALSIAVSSLTSGSYFAELARNAGNPVAVQQAEQAQLARQFSFSGTAVLTWILGGVLGALVVTLWGGAAATAVQQLTFDREKIAETFA